MKSFKAVITAISAWMDRIAGAAVVLMMLVVVYNVIVRVVNKLLPDASLLPSIIGEQDYVGLLMTVAVSFALAACALAGTHIAVSILHERFRRKTRFVLDIMTGSLGLLFIGLFSLQLFADAADKAAAHRVSTTAMVPTWPFIIITGLGFVALCLAILYNTINDARADIAGRKAEVKAPLQAETVREGEASS